MSLNNVSLYSVAALNVLNHTSFFNQFNFLSANPSFDLF